jgi:hypothetical protein
MIDEVSMMDGTQLDLIYMAIDDATKKEGKPFGLNIVGDFCQLAPVKGKWAFDADSWPKFAANTERLTKIWRQTDPAFINALNLVRAGEAAAGAKAFEGLGKWAVGLDNMFDGTTIFSKNVDVDNFNKLRYAGVQGKEIELRSRRWGKLRKEWDMIPDRFRLKIGAYVMILSNAQMDYATPDAELAYANGDCGHIVEFGPGLVRVKLARNGNVVDVPFIERFVESKERPKESYYIGLEPQDQPIYDDRKKKYLLGGIMYMPLRLAYAATVHKTQGLTLDRIQVDIRGHFFGSPSMAYVALSRVKSAEGLRIVGTPQLLERRISIADAVKPWV